MLVAWLFVVPLVGFLGGCSRNPPPPPALTEDLKAQIQQEDAAITEAEQFQTRYRP